MNKTESRKDEHVKVSLEKDVAAKHNYWDDIKLKHNALPEINKNEVDLSIKLFGKKLDAPLIIAGMTGGYKKAKDINKNELSKGLQKIMFFSTFCNQYFQKKQPWANEEKAKTTLYLCINAVRCLAILLEPYIPFSVEILWQILNLEGFAYKQNWYSASDLIISGKHHIKQPAILFEKIEDEDIQKEREKLQKLIT